jgi:hypothetical protein
MVFKAQAYNFGCLRRIFSGSGVSMTPQSQLQIWISRQILKLCVTTLGVWNTGQGENDEKTWGKKSRDIVSVKSTKRSEEDPDYLVSFYKDDI